MTTFSTHLFNVIKFRETEKQRNRETEKGGRKRHTTNTYEIESQKEKKREKKRPQTS